MYRLTDIVLPTANDERLLFADDTATTHVPPVLVREVVDTTAAGDSFNSVYLAARFGGACPEDAAKNGSRLAAMVVQHRGAIIPRNAMQLEP